MSFIDKFKIPYTNGIEWDNVVGKTELQRLGCCGKEIIAKQKKQYKTRISKLIESKELTQDEGNWLISVEQTGFQNSICIKEKNHKGRCSNVPYLPKEYKFGKTPKDGRDPLKVSINGMIAKIKDPINNPGGNPCPLQNRGGSRNNLTMLDKDTEKRLRQFAKNKRKEKYYVNLGIRLSMGATKYMIATAVIDMYTMIYFTKGVQDVFNGVPENFKKILNQRWEELKTQKLKEDQLVISDRNNNLQDPVDHRTIELKDYGVGHTDLNGIQFGHIKPIQENEWMTKGNNVMPLPRGSNLKQSNSDLRDVPLEQLRCGIEQIKRLIEENSLTEDYKSLLKEIVNLSK